MLAKWMPFATETQPTRALAPSLERFLSDPLFPSLPSLEDATPRSLLGALQFPQTDIVEDEDQLQLRVDLPGHDPASLQVKLEGDTLTLRSERKLQPERRGTRYARNERTYGVFARSFILPSTVDGARCQASYEHGVLTLTMPKREEAKPHTIEVQVRS